MLHIISAKKTINTRECNYYSVSMNTNETNSLFNTLIQSGLVKQYIWITLNLLRNGLVLGFFLGGHPTLATFSTHEITSHIKRGIYFVCVSFGEECVLVSMNPVFS